MHVYFERVCLLVILLFPFTSTAQVQLLNDEFEDGLTRDNWININDEEGWNITRLESYNVDDSVAGNLFLKPITGSWYGEYRGAYLYKYIVGDFVLTTEVRTTGRDGVSLPGSDYSLGGIMIREPLDDPQMQTSNAQNYIFMSIGQAEGPGFDFEIKNTCNSNSCLNIVPIGDTSIAKIRMARIGQQIVVLSKFPGQTNWTVRNRYDRTDLQCPGMGNCNAPFSDTLQIGFVSYTDWTKVFSYSTTFHNTHTLHPDTLGASDPRPEIPFNPDVLASYDYARFDTVSAPPGFNALTATNQELLTYFGYDTERFCPGEFNISDPISNVRLTAIASQVIKAENIIGNAADVHYKAGSEVSLDPGFEVGTTSSFQASIEGCINN